MRPVRLSISLLALLTSISYATSVCAWTAEIVRVDGERFTSRDGVELSLRLEARRLDGESTPLVAVDPVRVQAVLDEMRQWDGPPIPLRIYCLSGIPEAVGSSFAQGREIFLAANFAPPSDEVLAYTVAHELGHVVQHVRMPGRMGRDWLRYWELRGLDPTIHRDDARHRDRPSEIFAEDFRVVFGGPSATSSGTIENPGLDWTEDVAGLREYFLELARPAEVVTHGSAENYPNPFNPTTVIRAELSDDMLIPGARVQIDLFDLRGRHLFRFPSQAVAPLVELNFRGLDARGRPLASGVYLYWIRVGERGLQGRMTLVR